MSTESPPAWPARRGMPALATLDEPTRRKVRSGVKWLRERQGDFGGRFLGLARERLPGYEVLTDEEIRTAAQHFMDTMIEELAALRVPDPALRDLLHQFAAERAVRGVPPDVLAAGYQLGSRLMLALLDEMSADVGLPAGLMLAIHDSTWEFANEASSVFTRAQHDLALERAQFDAERRSAFAGGVLSGAFPAGQINRDARLFGLDPQASSVPLAARAASPDDADAIRRAIASALRMPADRLLFAEVGASLGFIAPAAPAAVAGHLVAAGPAVVLDQLHSAFTEAVLTLDTALQFQQTGVVRLADLGPRPLVLSSPAVAAALHARHLKALDGPGRANADIEETTRIYLDCNQDVRETARRLAVHQNTVRYRVQRFHELTGLDVRLTEDLVTAWWLLNGRREKR